MQVRGRLTFGWKALGQDERKEHKMGIAIFGLEGAGMKSVLAAVLGASLACPAFAQSPVRLQCKYERTFDVKPLRRNKAFQNFSATVQFARTPSGAILLATSRSGPCTSFTGFASEHSFEGRCSQTVNVGNEPMAVARTIKINRATGAFEEMYWMGSSPALPLSGQCVPGRRRVKISR
jgi:hypothetical protein